MPDSFDLDTLEKRYLPVGDFVPVRGRDFIAMVARIKDLTAIAAPSNRGGEAESEPQTAPASQNANSRLGSKSAEPVALTGSEACCDTPSYCSAARRCTAKDAATGAQGLTFDAIKKLAKGFMIGANYKAFAEEIDILAQAAPSASPAAPEPVEGRRYWNDTPEAKAARELHGIDTQSASPSPAQGAQKDALAAELWVTACNILPDDEYDPHKHVYLTWEQFESCVERVLEDRAAMSREQSIASAAGSEQK